jgi:acyl-CoA hydrolase
MNQESLTLLVRAMIRAAGPAYQKELMKVLDRLHDYSSSCGEGAFEYAQRRAWNERVDNIINEVKHYV